MKKIGLVLEGGAFRGVFTAGALNYLAEQQISFPYIVGVSSGAVNAVGYLCGQSELIRRIIDGGSGDSYFGITGFGQNPNNPVQALFDYSLKNVQYDLTHFFASDTDCEFVLTDCDTGLASYLTPGNSEDEVLRACRAACAVPLLCEPVEIDGHTYVDGGVSDAIPVQHALETCDRAVVILTRRPEEEPTDYARMAFLIDICYRGKFPRLADALIDRHNGYKKQRRELARLEKEGRVFVIRPTLAGIHHFESDRAKTEEFYRHGYETMQEQFQALATFLEGRS
jgi:predicted patatin/cPLA2 family phospholipase